MRPTVIYKVYSDDDIGESEYVYLSRSDAISALERNPMLTKVLDEEGLTLQDFLDREWVVIEELTVR